MFKYKGNIVMGNMKLSLLAVILTMFSTLLSAANTQYMYVDSTDSSLKTIVSTSGASGTANISYYYNVPMVTLP